jgi:hypothetical protein
MGENDNKWPSVVRMVWLSGGLVAISEPGKTVKIEAGINGPVLFSYQLDSFGSLFGTLVAHGYSVIGATYITDVEESQGIRTPGFRAYFNNQSKWRAFEVHQQWRNLAHAAAQRDEMALMDIASRIATELAYCESRLQSLAEAYAIQLGSKARQGDVNEAGGFKDTNSQRVYMAIHAMFWEMAALRDYFAEFASQFVFGLGKVSKFSELKPKLSHVDMADDELAGILREAGNENPTGWLFLFSKYRNLFTHDVPMANVEEGAFAQLVHVRLAQGQAHPEIYYPLPSDVQAISKRRKKGIHPQSFEDFINDSVHRNQTANREKDSDSLLYLHSIFEKMVAIAEMLIARSPREPEMMHLTERDIVGEVKVYQGGELVFQGAVPGAEGK